MSNPCWHRPALHSIVILRLTVYLRGSQTWCVANLPSMQQHEGDFNYWTSQGSLDYCPPHRFRLHVHWAWKSAAGTCRCGGMRKMTWFGWSFKISNASTVSSAVSHHYALILGVVVDVSRHTR